MTTKKIVKRVVTKNRSVAVFFVADDVRLEQGGKPTLLGFFPDGIVQLRLPKGIKPPTTKTPIALQSLAILGCFSNAKRKNKIEIELHAPDGSILYELRDGQAQSEGDSLNVVARFAAMPVVGWGIYKVVVRLNNKPYDFSFEIKRDPRPFQKR
jgi:hypothetical protein